MTDDPTPAPPGRLRLLGLGLAAAMALLLGALAYWQLGHAADANQREARQSLRRRPLPAVRGAIYDRHHRLLAGHRPHTALAVDPGALQAEIARAQGAELDAGETPALAATRARQAALRRCIERAHALTGRGDGLDAAAVERAFVAAPTTPLVLVADLTPAELARISAPAGSLAPLMLQATEERWYPHDRLAAHTIGRVRRPGPGQAESGDFGIEKQFDERLRGQPGEVLVRVDAAGFPVGAPIATVAPVAGGDVVLSIDLDLQAATERAMAEAVAHPRGAAVALSIRTGEILALASKPDFDLNAVAPAIEPALKRQIETEGGWLNRATQALYPPGSTFKIFTALAGLRAHTLHPADVLLCDGGYTIGDRRFPCHLASGHGAVALRAALAHSCNAFAYQAGLRAGPAALAAEARRFHLATPTGIELPGESRRMLVPDPAWKEAGGRGAWTPGDTANLAIGQGFLRCSPLQLACALASLARRETLTVPTLLLAPARSASGEDPAEPLALAEPDYAALVAGLRDVVEIGIGREAQVPGVRLAGKTGTAQIPRGTVAWFVAFAPVERPEIAVAVALEGGEAEAELTGAAHAAPVAREILAQFFSAPPAGR